MNEPLSPENKPSSAKSTWHRSSNRRPGLWLLLSLFALILIIYFIKYHNTKPVQAKPAAAVVLAVVQNKNVPVMISALGNVVATYTVTVRTQINGLLMNVPFKEGQFVKKGDLLAEIDQRLLLAQLTEYEGQLLRDQALLANALIDLQRYQRLWKQDSVSQQTLATQESLVRQYQGTVEIDQGLIQSTKVNLMYCNITSPIDGRVGLRLVDPGNFVQTSDTSGIAVITTLDPITVIFTIPEDDVPRVLPQVLAKQDIKVQAYDRQQNSLLGTGTLITMDNQIDTTTGTVRLRAKFDNKENKLYSNQFVNIQLLVANLPNATVVSTAAVQHGSKGDFVYLLNPDFTVSIKPIKTGITSGDDTVIQEGLTLGQQVVVDGVDKLTDGAKVRIADNSKASEQAGKKLSENT